MNRDPPSVNKTKFFIREEKKKNSRERPAQDETVCQRNDRALDLEPLRLLRKLTFVQTVNDTLSRIQSNRRFGQPLKNIPVYQLH